MRLPVSVISFFLLAAPALAWDIPFFHSFSTNRIGGVPRIVDGDTLAFDKIKVRLVGIDTPEKAQRCLDEKQDLYMCGEVASQRLAEKIAGREVWCVPELKPDRYQRVLGTCVVGHEDLNQWLVSEGLAVAYGKTYKENHDLAKSKRVGLWRGAFVEPKEWRKQNWQANVWGAKPVVLEAYPQLIRRAGGRNKIVGE